MATIMRTLIWLVIAAPAIYLALVWNKLPARVAVHFDIAGTTDRYGSKNELLVVAIFISVINLAIYVVFSNLHRLDKRKYTVQNKSRFINIAFAITIFVSAMTLFIIDSCVRGVFRLDMRFILAGVGLLFAIIGNYMSNIKPNYYAGFRVKWTLQNEDIWKKTHLLAGRLWFASGLIIAIICLIIPKVAALIIFFAILLIIIIIPGVYSYRLYKKNKAY